MLPGIRVRVDGRAPFHAHKFGTIKFHCKGPSAGTTVVRIDAESSLNCEVLIAVDSKHLIPV
jgi:hypothetical protein